MDTAYWTAGADPIEISIASQGYSTIGCGYNRAWTEEAEKERSEVKCLCTGTPPTKLKDGGWLEVRGREANTSIIFRKCFTSWQEGQKVGGGLNLRNNAIKHLLTYSCKSTMTHK